MPLAPGTWLAHYEILGHIGSGGMGDVYHARDNKLQREVALKVLPEHFARDPERIARFRREAQLLAQLNHPNIAILYNFEETGETRFLVMELVLGETLRERIKRGPVPIEESLEICSQITEALEHAHEKPIIHRDLKPANVKVTPQGQVKVLDFGLAKAFGGDKVAIDPHDAPTGSLAGTLKGTILGTPAYMPPEQASGRTVDKRADIWAFGCVLYELLTGKQAFTGDTVTEIIASVLKSEPDWSALPADTGPNVRVLLRRCLRKDLPGRFRDATDVRIQIEEAQGASAATPPIAPAVAPPPVWRRLLPWGVAVALSIVVGVAAWNLRPSPTPPAISRFALALPTDERLGNPPSPAVALSPDGRQLVYVANTAGGGLQRLYLRAMDSLEAKPIPGTEDALNPFFSPDGQWIGFFASNKLKKVSTNGGLPLTICDAPVRYGATWGPKDTIVFAPSIVSGLSVVPAAGGTPQVLTKLDTAKGEIAHRWPEFLPGGKAILFAVGAGANFADAGIVVQNLETGERRTLVQGGTYPRYSPTGHLLYYRTGTLMAVPFDLARLDVKGMPFPVVEGVMSAIGGTGGAQFGISNNGLLVYVPGAAEGTKRRLVWVDRKGGVQPLPAPPQEYRRPSLAPDGRQIAVEIQTSTDDIWVYDIPRNTLTRLTFEGINERPLWMPDGKRIVFGSTKGGALNLFWKPADGSGAEEQITKSEHFFQVYSISPDGKLAAYTEIAPTTSRDIWVVPLEGERKPRVLLQTQFDETIGVFSPDGRWIAYASNESGRFEVYVRPFPGPGGKWQISTDGGEQHAWARNGRELFFRSGDKMMAVDITTDPTFRAGTPRLLFEGQYEGAGGPGRNYDVSPDGQRFLMIKASEQQQTATQINVVLNWFEELKRRVPAGR